MRLFLTAAGAPLPQRLNEALNGDRQRGDCFRGASGGQSLCLRRERGWEGSKAGKMASAPGSPLSTGASALVGIHETMGGLELAGLLRLVPTVGGEKFVSSKVACAAERLWTSLRAARCKGDTAESGQSCGGVPERCRQSPSWQFPCQLNIHLSSSRKP